MGQTTFIDGIILSQRFPTDSVKTIAGLRTIAFREPGDISFDGSTVEERDILPERLRSAWIQGSHSTKVQVSSDGTLVQLKGNPGRFGRSDNVFNLGWDETFAASNRILHSQGLPAFVCGEQAASPRIFRQVDGDMASRAEFAHYLCIPEPGTPEYAAARRFSHDGDLTPGHEGARVWSIHVTRNLVTGSESNAIAVLNWLDGQSVARVKKKRFGKSTVVWGSLKYCQVEAYLKADEMMDHCRGEIEREMMRQNPVYHWCRENGVVRVEVKAAKDCLRDRGLTWAGDWTMTKVIQLFEDRTEILHRVKADVEEFDPAMLPSNVSMTASAWLRGEDVRRVMKRATFYRHAALLREYGIDIAEPRNVASMPVRIKTIDIQPAGVPDWYDFKPSLVRAA